MNITDHSTTIAQKAGLFYTNIVPVFSKNSLSRSIYVVAKLKIAELLEKGPMNAVDISEKLGCKADILLRILNFVASKGIFKKDSEERFENTESSLQLRCHVLGDAIISDQDRNWKKLAAFSDGFNEAISSKAGDEKSELWGFARGYILSRAIYAAAVQGIDTIYNLAPFQAVFEGAGFVDGDLLTPQGELLREPGCREFLKHEIEERWIALGELEMAVRTGKIPFEELYKQSFFEFLKLHPKKSENFDKSMTFVTECEFAALKPNIQAHFAPGMTVVDVGGGYGKFLAGLLEGHREVLGILFDQELSVRNHEIPSHLEKQVVICPGSFFVSIPKADIYVIKRVLHDWGDKECIEILKKCRESMKPGSKLLINEFALPHPIAIGVDINMITIFNGRQRTVEEFEALCQAAGWEVVQVTPTECGITTFTAI